MISSNKQGLSGADGAGRTGSGRAEQLENVMGRAGPDRADNLEN